MVSITISHKALLTYDEAKTRKTQEQHKFFVKFS